MVQMRKSLQNTAMAFVFAVLFSSFSAASISVTVSTSAPASLQDQFIQDISALYDGTLNKSASSNVWTFKITGKKPPAQTVCSDNFIDGYVFGIDDERYRDLKILKPYSIDCSTPSNEIYQQWFSTPTAMP